VESAVLSSRATRIAATVAWVLAAAGAVWLSTVGLAASFYIEGTDEALAAARHGQDQVLVAAFVLLGLATASWVVFEARPWSVVVLGVTAVVLLVGGTLDLAFVLIPLPYFAVPAAAYGVLFRPGPTPGSASPG
jgi:hypothetical protein